MTTSTDEASRSQTATDKEEESGKQLVVLARDKSLDVQNIIRVVVTSNGNKNHHHQPSYDTEDDDDDDLLVKSLIDYPWSQRILRLIGNKAKLMESFTWLSTVGGGYSALGESDHKFSIRAGALSLGQQLHLAERLGDERLKVMCHLFAALAALQLNNKYFCLNYIKRVIIPLINAMPYRDPIVTNILRHICFRMSLQERNMAIRNNAINDH